MSKDQIYLYRRKGLSDYATCDRARYVELSQHKLFETMICYGSAEAAERMGIDLELTRLARQGDKIEIDGLKALNDGLRAELGECKGEYDRAVNKVDALREALHVARNDLLAVAHLVPGDYIQKSVASAEAAIANAEPSKAGPIPADMAALALKLSQGPGPEEVRRNQAIAMGIKIEPANKESAQ